MRFSASRSTVKLTFSNLVRLGQVEVTSLVMAGSGQCGDVALLIRNGGVFTTVQQLAVNKRNIAVIHRYSLKPPPPPL